MAETKLVAEHREQLSGHGSRQLKSASAFTGSTPSRQRM
jgi:hypothetical protein